MQKFTPGAVTQKVRFSFAAEEGWRVGPYDRYNWGYNRIYNEFIGAKEQWKKTVVVLGDLLGIILPSYVGCFS